jgi:hypothetical protein
MDRTGPAVENFSKSIASVTSGARSPTYLITFKNYIETQALYKL